MTNSDPIKNCIEAATEGLKPDPELRMDIAHELRTHLEDTIAEQKAAGASDEESLQHALKTFGDPQEVSRDLLRANLRRMRLRAVAKWAARVTLMPALIVIMCIVLFKMGEAATGMSAMNIMLMAAHGVPGVPHFSDTRVGRWFEQRASRPRLRKDLTEDEKFLYHGNPNTKNRLEWARGLVERFPNDPTVYGYYTIWFILRNERFLGDNEHLPSAEQRKALDETIAVLNRGEEIDPDNAFYNYMKAFALFVQGAKLEVDKEATYVVEQGGKQRTRKAMKVVVRDLALVDRAIEECRRGNTKSFYDSYSAGFAQRRLNLRCSPETLTEEIRRSAVMAGLLLPDLSMMRSLERGTVAYAKLLAAEGRRKQSLMVLREAEIPPLKLGACHSTLIGCLVGHATRQIHLDQGALVYEKLDMTREAEQARAEAKQLRAALEKLRKPDPSNPSWASQEQRRKHAGAMLHGLGSAAFRYNKELFRAWRLLERAIFERLIATVFLVLGFFGVLVIGVSVLISLARGRGGVETPRLFFPGWGRVVGIVCWSVLSPMAAYFTYTRLMPLGGSEYGVNYAPARILLELTITGMGMIAIMLVTTYSAIRARCAEAGMAVPASGTFRPGWVLILVGLACIALLIIYGLNWEDKSWRDGEAGVWIVATLLVGGFAWVIAMCIRFIRLSKEFSHFRNSLRRSMLPLIAVVLILAGLTVHLSLGWAEKRHVTFLQRPGNRLFTDEMEMSAFKTLRDQMAAEHRALMAQRTTK